MSEKDRKRLNIDIDMLRGNINRMCVTDDFQELQSMHEWAIARVDMIFNANRKRLEEKNDI